ncbi:MAG: family 16 glycoside hydrolase [Verrucomicrobiota bacterium]
MKLRKVVYRHMGGVALLLGALLLAGCGGQDIAAESEAKSSPANEVMPASTVTVSLELTTKRSLAGQAELSREKYFNMHTHSGYGVLSRDDLSLMRDELGVRFGRAFNGPFWYFKGEDSLQTPFPAEEQAKSLSRALTDLYETQLIYEFRDRRMVITDHPYDTFHMDLDLEAAADWTVSYFKHFYNDSTRPIFYEPMNEPFVHAKDYGKDLDAVKKKMAGLYREIGKAFDEAELDVNVVGYASAWPSMELHDFQHWRSNMQMFMDTAGEYMDGIAVHLYDGTNVTGQDNRRSGSNSEAILDMIETYSYIKWGEIKPHAITEYGDIPKGYPEHYTDEKSSQEHRAYNHILFSLLEREDRLLTSIPFITSKSPWFYSKENDFQPYLADLWRPDPDKIVNDKVQGYLFTKKIYFYQLWQGVQGARTVVETDNPDIQVRTFVDGATAYICLNNYDDFPHEVKLEGLSDAGTFQRGSIRRLDVPVREAAIYTDETLSQPVNTLVMQPFETIVLTYDFTAPVKFQREVTTRSHYAKTYLQPIQANQTITFQIDGVPASAERAHLRLGLARKPDQTKQPVLKVNGQVVEVPDNWPGYDQANRSDFFGAIPVPLDPAVLQAENTIEIEFPDDGGRVSTVVLVTESLVSEDQRDWVELFDGQTLNGWTAQGDVNWRVEDGAIVADTGEISLLTYDQKFRNYELELEFRAAQDTNSGVFLNSEPVVRDEATDCYEVNIAPPSNGFPTGSVVKFVRVEGQGERDEWRKYQLKVQDNQVTVVLDGQQLVEHTAEYPRPAGYIGLQKNRGRIAFRNIRLRERL